MIELLTNAEMAEADRRTIASGTPGMTLMENAGRAVADAVAIRHPPASRVAVVAGPGSNGGDGFVAARHLAHAGYSVSVLLVGDMAKLKGDAAEAARRWRGPTTAATPAALSGCAVIIDALFGAGLDRPVEGAAKTMIEAMNASGAPIVAVDLASGVNGTTGAVMGVAVNATESVTFFRKKPGHLLLRGRICCGPVRIAQIGIEARTLEAIRPQTFENDPRAWRHLFPVPQHGGHKYTRGHAVVVSGGPVTTGAARLAARGALRAGAGLVTLASPREAMAVNAPASVAVMVRPVDGAAELAAFLQDRRFNAVALGPGLGVAGTTCALVESALSGERSVVLDADALTSFSDDPRSLFRMIAARKDQTTVLTPHEGEFARIFKCTAESAQSKLERARRAARDSDGIVVLKGSDTVIAAPDGRAAINGNAPAWLATAGAGDVLTGIIAGLTAQGMPGFEAACAAVWLHGEAAAAFGPGLISEDLPELLPPAFRRFLGQTSA